ncbi:hypothetical protein GCM10009836_50790 [Pseudonocardia ailaonensis]|uniref:SRPBCC family protein n=1 Tax=Pseudonocardia ailaonensis TaxID=367279 RepID=A0ABN2NEN4_9PSEU
MTRESAVPGVRTAHLGGRRAGAGVVAAGVLGVLVAGAERIVRSVRPTRAEAHAPRPGDAVLPHPDVVMDRAFTVPGAPDDVWPWIAQLGKQRGGWYLPVALERVLPHRNRATRSLLAPFTDLAVGDVVPDYGGPHETFTVAALDPPRSLVYSSRRGRTDVTWSITLEEAGDATRVALRLRLHPVRHRWLATTVGELFDLLTIAGMAAGLRERLSHSAPPVEWSVRRDEPGGPGPDTHDAPPAG